MRLPIFLFVSLAAAVANAAPDPVAACRSAHADDPEAHIACLEAALRSRDYVPVTASADDPDGDPDDDPNADPEIAVQIIATTYDSRGIGTFRCADGQVWRETMASPERKRLDPEREYTARIVRGTFGGYRMHVDGVRAMKTVERIE